MYALSGLLVEWLAVMSVLTSVWTPIRVPLLLTVRALLLLVGTDMPAVDSRLVGVDLAQGVFLRRLDVVPFADVDGAEQGYESDDCPWHPSSLLSACAIPWKVEKPAHMSILFYY